MQEWQILSCDDWKSKHAHNQVNRTTQGQQLSSSEVNHPNFWFYLDQRTLLMEQVDQQCSLGFEYGEAAHCNSAVKAEWSHTAEPQTHRGYDVVQLHEQYDSIYR